jgi:hypothetical protein
MTDTRTKPPAPPHAFDTLHAEVEFVLDYLTEVGGWERGDALDAITCCVTSAVHQLRSQAA